MGAKKRYWSQVLLISVLLMAVAGLIFGLFHPPKYPPQIEDPRKHSYDSRHR